MASGRPGRKEECDRAQYASDPNGLREVMNDLKIAPELTIICALAVGYPDPDSPTNKLRIGRDPVAKHVVFSTAGSEGKRVPDNIVQCASRL